MIPINLKLVLSGMNKTYRQDAHRIGLFVAAIASKSVEIATTNPNDLQAFAVSSSDLIAAWTNRTIDVAKSPLKFAFKDPFKELRAQTRTFANVWSLDPVFVTAMG